MKPLIIHNNNSYLISQNVNYLHSLGFSANNKEDIDFQITEFLLKNVLPINTTAIFIKAILSTNYLEYLGLRVAIHIRLSSKLPQLQELPIIILCEETFEELSKTCQFPEFLHTEGLYFSNESPEQLDIFINLLNQGKLPGCNSIPDLVKSLHIAPPANYLSHHSIANEWSILRWAKVLNIPTETPLLYEVRKNIESFLYYKYLQVLNPISNLPGCTGFNIKGKGKILYIDDEWNKGWDVVLRKLVSSSPDVLFETFKNDFKDKSHNEILEDCKNKILSNSPDVVLLDLRLSDSDFSGSTKSNELTGYKVLREIKNINPGIQVIIFTASNKVWNLLDLQLAGANGFCLKESPELSINSSFSIESLKSLCDQVSNCLSYAYLKEIWSLSDQIKKVFSKNPLTTKYFPKNLHEQLNGIKYQNLLLQELDAMFEILKTNNENRLNFSMIMLYKILEYLNEIFYQKVPADKAPVFFDGITVDFFDRETKTWKKPNDSLIRLNKSTKKPETRKINFEWLKSTSNKSINLAVKKLKINDDSLLFNLISLSNYRNDFIHSDTSRRNKLKSLNAQDILIWMNSVASIIKKI